MSQALCRDAKSWIGQVERSDASGRMGRRAEDDRARLLRAPVRDEGWRNDDDSTVFTLVVHPFSNCEFGGIEE